MKSIPVSKKYGLNPTIPVCFWCGKAKNEIALMGRMSKGNEHDVEAPHYMVLDFEPCDTCKTAMDSGFVVMEATNVPNESCSVEMQTGVYPTGAVAVLKNEAAGKLFGPEIVEKHKAFVDRELFTKLFRQGA